MMNKDTKAIAAYYRKWQHTEFQICRRLNYHMPDKLVNAGYAFIMNVKDEYDSEGQFQKNDMVLIQITPERERKEIIKVEFEYGAEQYDWDFELPRNRWMALNLGIRKKYGETFSLFIKSSPTYRSLFAIDCRNKFVQKHFGNRIETLEHSLEFVTDNKFYRIYWNKLPEHQFIIDEQHKKIIDGNICIIEDDNWLPFYRFLWQRFLK